MKTANTTLTAAVVLALGSTVTGQVSAGDNRLIDVASGALIEEGQSVQVRDNAISGTRDVVFKAAPKRKTPAKKR